MNAEPHAGAMPDRVPHGLGGYTNHACRCDTCRLALRAYRANRVAARRAERITVNGRLFAVNAFRHGEDNTYVNWACRCHACTDAHNEYQRAYRGSRMGRAS